jgi:hypothetical protein
MHDCVDNLPVLTTLDLSFHAREKSSLAWQIFAPGPPFPMLSWLRIHHCKCFVKDFTTFILKHSNTLEELRVHETSVDPGSEKDLHAFFATLRNFPLLEYFSLNGLYLNGTEMEFPGVYTVASDDEEDEDGWIRVHKWSHLQRFDGREEVLEGLGQMAQILA